MKRAIRALVFGSGVVTLAGCASVSNDGPPRPAVAAVDTWDHAVPAGKERYQFSPLPTAETASQDLDPALPRSADEILADAQREFEATRDAQAMGDNATAYDHYAQMMDRLIEAKLDPATFDSLRQRYSSELQDVDTLARIYERTRPDQPAAPALDGQVDGTTEINVRVQAEIEAIQKVYPKSFQAGLDRSYKYLPYVRAKFAEAGLPDDLVWLAMVESQYSPKIDSRAGASGMWQFMKGTGRRYGLRTDWYLDERYDWRKATGAAVEYLTDLYEMFDGNWPLAVTAYNMGEGGLERAIQKAGGEDDLWQLLEAKGASSRIKLESKRFYAKLLATAIVAKNPEQYGFEARPQDGEETEPIKVTGAYSLADIEKQSGFEPGTLAKLNPQFIRGYTPPAREAILAVPAGHNGRVLTALASLPELHAGTHVVQRGETLSQIAKQYKVSAEEIQTANKISSPRNLKTGQRLIIPGGDNFGTDDGVVMAKASGSATYTVRKGDSLSGIADRNRVSVRELQLWNNLGNSTSIRAGQQLTVAKPGVEPRTAVASAKPAPVKSEPAVVTISGKAPAADPVYYTVKKGDFPDKIAKAHGISLDKLLALNGLSKRSKLQIGQKLVVGTTPEKTVVATSISTTPELSGTSNVSDKPATKATVAAAPRVPQTHVVRKGETISSIAKQHGVTAADLFSWNKLSAKSILHIGDTLVLESRATKVAAADNATGTDTHVANAIPDGTVRQVHVVAPGERATAIADLYDVPVTMLYEWNGWTRTPVLNAGDEVVVYQPVHSQD